MLIVARKKARSLSTVPRANYYLAATTTTTINGYKTFQAINTGASIPLNKTLNKEGAVLEGAQQHQRPPSHACVFPRWRGKFCVSFSLLPKSKRGIELNMQKQKAKNYNKVRPQDRYMRLTHTHTHTYPQSWDG